jgi:hypothetical protein
VPFNSRAAAARFEDRLLRIAAVAAVCRGRVEKLDKKSVAAAAAQTAKRQESSLKRGACCAETTQRRRGELFRPRADALLQF